MRISDWSSDVCSSDLIIPFGVDPGRPPLVGRRPGVGAAGLGFADGAGRRIDHHDARVAVPQDEQPGGMPRQADRKSVVSGKRVSVRVSLGGPRISQKTKSSKKCQLLYIMEVKQ